MQPHMTKSLLGSHALLPTKLSLTLGCAESEVDGLLCTQCAVSEGSDGHCILSHCLQTCQGPTCVCCVSHCRCPIQPVNAVHEGPHVWG